MLVDEPARWVASTAAWMNRSTSCCENIGVLDVAFCGESCGICAWKDEPEDENAFGFCVFRGEVGSFGAIIVVVATAMGVGVVFGLNRRIRKGRSRFAWGEACERLYSSAAQVRKRRTCAREENERIVESS